MACEGKFATELYNLLYMERPESLEPSATPMVQESAAADGQRALERAPDVETTTATTFSRACGGPNAQP
jgi:hypothetical protein